MDGREEEIGSSDEELQAVCHFIAKRQRYIKGPRKFAEAVSQLMTKRGYGRIQTSVAFESAWIQAAGADLANNSRIGTVRRGVLEIQVVNSSVMQEANFMKRTLLERLNKLLPQQSIVDIRFRIGSVQ